MSPIRRLGTVLLSAALTAQLLTACAPGNAAPGGVEGPRWEDLEYDRSLELQYAQQFSVDYYQDGYSLVEIQEVGTYLVAPQRQQCLLDWTRGSRCSGSPGPNLSGGHLSHGSIPGTG